MNDFYRGYMQGFKDVCLQEQRSVSEQISAQHVGEPWGACVSGRVFVGALPEHVRKLSEDGGLPIQWLYTTQQQRKPLTEEQREEIAKGWQGRNWTVGNIIDAIEAAHGITKEDK